MGQGFDCPGSQPWRVAQHPVPAQYETADRYYDRYQVYCFSDTEKLWICQHGYVLGLGFVCQVFQGMLWL